MWLITLFTSELGGFNKKGYEDVRKATKNDEVVLFVVPHIERLEQYFGVNRIGALPAGAEDNDETRQAAGKKRVATFLTLVGGKAYKLLKSLVSPNLPSTKPLRNLLKH